MGIHPAIRAVGQTLRHQGRSIVRSTLKSAAWTAGTFGITMAVCEKAKEPLMRHDAYSDTAPVLFWGYPVTYATNPHVSRILENDGLRAMQKEYAWDLSDHEDPPIFNPCPPVATECTVEMRVVSKLARSQQGTFKVQGKMVDKAPPGQFTISTAPITARPTLERSCTKYFVQLESLIARDDETDGMKLIKLHTIDGLVTREMIDRYAVRGGDPVSTEILHHVNEQAINAIEDKRTLEAYNPWETGALLLTAFGLFYFNYRKEDEYSETNWSFWSGTLGFFMTVGAGLFSVYSADNIEQRHDLGPNSFCAHVFEPGWVNQRRMSDMRRESQKTSWDKVVNQWDAWTE